MNRAAALLAPTVGLLLVASACSGSSSPSPTPPDGLPSADAVAKQLAAGLASGNVASVPMTTPPAAAQAELRTLTAGMDGLRPSVTAGQPSYDKAARTATVALQQSLPLGKGTWAYSTTATLRYAGNAWQVEWAPQVVEPDLSATTRLRHLREVPKRAAINGSDGQALVEVRTAYQVGIDKQNLAKNLWAPTATKLAGILKVDAAAYAKQVAAAGPQAFVSAITLREAEIPEAARSVKGSSIVPVELPLAPSSTFAVSILGSAGQATPEVVKASRGDVLAGDVVGLSGLQKRYDAQLRGTVGHIIELVNRSQASSSASPDAPATPDASASPGGSASPGVVKTLFSEAASAGTPVATSLDRDLQAKAEQALASQQGVASLVVVKVGSGDILAAANSSASGANPDATVGRYAPGSTFKVVSSLALLRKGMTPANPVPCTSSITVDGRRFTNYSDFPAAKVGTISLTDALANSCNTAFISQAPKLGPTDLAQAANSLGVGTDHDAGYASFFGSVPTAPDAVTKAADMIGQGTVEASPMAMAGVAASVASGRTVLPWLVAAAKPVAAGAPLTAAEAAQLQQMMKAVVTSGSGRVLAGQVTGAKTGTAEYGTATPPKTHAWMIAWNSSYAIAVMVNDGESGSKTAAPVIKAFLGQS